MEPAEHGGAWLESKDGQIWELKNNCRLGRHPECDVVIESEKTSRNHAVIISDQSGATLIDGPSLNGTFLNDQQIFYPVKLIHGDKITIGGVEFFFHQPTPATGTAPTFNGGPETVLDVRQRNVWLMIADINGFTQLIQDIPPQELQTMVGGWFRKSSGILKDHGSRISKYLGDGFLAYWQESPGAAATVAATLRDFQKLRLENLEQSSPLTFRIAVHRGLVNFGGQSYRGEESMFGEEQNFAFRMEKLAGELGLDNLASEPVKLPLEGHLTLRYAEAHQLEGFDGLHRCYEIVFPADAPL